MVVERGEAWNTDLDESSCAVQVQVQVLDLSEVGEAVYPLTVYLQARPNLGDYANVQMCDTAATPRLVRSRSHLFF